jgi:hypothetical protein
MADHCDIAAYAAWQRRITPLVRDLTTSEGWLLPDERIERRAPFMTREAYEEIQAARLAVIQRAGVDPETDEAWCASPEFAASAAQQLIDCWAATPNNAKRFAAAVADELVGQHREYVIAAILELRRTRKTLPSVACVRAAVEAEQVDCKGDDYEGEDDRDTGWRPWPGVGTKAWRAFPSAATIGTIEAFERNAIWRATGKDW